MSETTRTARTVGDDGRFIDSNIISVRFADTGETVRLPKEQIEHTHPIRVGKHDRNTRKGMTPRKVAHTGGKIHKAADVRRLVPLNLAEYQQNEKDDDQCANEAGGSGSPRRTMRPCGERANQKQDQNHQ